MIQALFRFALILVAAMSTLAGLVWAVGSPINNQPVISSKAIESSSQVKMSEGAAPGYVADKACATCHSDIYKSYQHVGMSKSFSLPTKDKLIENFDLPPYFHQPSQRYYQIVNSEEGLLFRRWQLDEKGERANAFERKIDFILGSGHKTRVYLYREPGGELFQLPIGWYTGEQQWGMAPGYDNKQHQGVTRPVLRECMFCHNAYPDVKLGSDNHWEPDIFPAELPEGTGCQRCHGPGGKHIATVMGGAVDLNSIRNSIVNPAKLEVAKRDSVCFQCHLLPSVDLTGPRAFDRPTYSYRPGEDINDYIHHVDVVDDKVKREDRFEINHHAYRLRQSRCFNQSEGALTCISCHNPHKKVAKEDRAEHYGKVCQSCHEKPLHQPPLAENSDCVSCHMPQRRTQDVVKVVMTDHKIQRNNKKEDWLKPLQEEDPVLVEVDFLMPEKSPSGDMAQIYKVATLLRNAPNANYVDYLHSMLAKVQPKELQPYFDLVKGQLLLKRFKQAEKLSRWLLQKMPNNFRLEQWLAAALQGQGQGALGQAEDIYKRLLQQRPEIAEIHFNYALLLLRSQQSLDKALWHLEKAIALRNSFTLAWFYRAQIVHQQGQLQLAVDYYRQVLVIDPAVTRAYLGLSEVLVKQKQRAEAIRYLKLGEKFARQPEMIEKQRLLLQQNLQ